MDERCDETCDRPPRFTLPRAHRLRLRRDFERVFAARRCRHAGPLRIHAVPNGLDHPRLGLSVSRRVGKATVRNRVKRMLREAYRLSRHELPPGIDMVVVVRPHAPATLLQYQQWLAKAAAQLALDARESP